VYFLLQLTHASFYLAEIASAQGVALSGRRGIPTAFAGRTRRAGRRRVLWSWGNFYSL